MLWQARNNTDAQHMTIDTKGQMVMKSKRELKRLRHHAEADYDHENAITVRVDALTEPSPRERA